MTRKRTPEQLTDEELNAKIAALMDEKNRREEEDKKFFKEAVKRLPETLAKVPGFTPPVAEIARDNGCGVVDALKLCTAAFWRLEQAGKKHGKTAEDMLQYLDQYDAMRQYVTALQATANKYGCSVNDLMRWINTPRQVDYGRNQMPRSGGESEAE